MQLVCRRAIASFAVVFFFLGFASIAFAQNTIHVPADVPDIQDAIFQANNGDTILVSPGTYFGSFQYLGKNITIQSTDGPAATIINGGSAFFVNGESQQAVLRGFTITNASAFQDGGGINIVNSSPTIDGNIITANQACNGAGISANSSSAIIRNNIISNNTTTFCSPATGGGGVQIVGPGNVQLLNNTIVGNQQINGGNGGGIVIDVEAAPLVSGNLIQNNSASGNGGGVAVGSSAQLINNVITGNTGSQGGGIYGLLNQAQPSFINNTVANNSAGSGQGSQLFLDGFDANVEIANNLWIDFTATGAVFCGDSSGQIPAFDHNDVFSSSPSAGQVAAYGGACTDVTGISGNIQADPQFVDPVSSNYHLLPSSPALDAGNNFASNLPSSDLEGNLRVAASNTATCVGIVDMGAYELVAPSTGTGFLSPSSLDFGTAQIGTPGFPQQFTFFANQGCVQAAVQIHGDFQQTSNCTALQAGNSCTIQVTFNPTAPGPRTGSLQLNLGPGVPPVVASLTGRALNSLVSFPSSLDFGGQPINSGFGVQQGLSVESQSSLPLQVTGISTTGDFSLQNNCSQSFGFGCSVVVTFNPTTAGLRSGILTITSNLGILTVPLSGTGLAPIASVAPSSLVFASQTVGTSSQSQIVTLTNSGALDMLINGFNASPDYFVQPVTCSGLVSAGTSCTFSVTFQPLTIGDRSGSLEIDTNGGNVTVALSGTGTPPIATLAPQLLTFPAAPIGTTGATQTVSVTNISGSQLQLTAIGATNNFFAFSTCPATLDPNASCSINVSFVPGTAGPYNGFLTLSTNFGNVTAVLSADDGHHTFHVPADYPTIMSAISIAQDGDTVLVSPGTYVEQINFQGKAITVASSGGPATTIIDGQNGFSPIVFADNEPPQAVLRGFTITRAAFSAIQVSGAASPTIEDNIITNNSACGGGTGIQVSSLSAIIRHNTISNNINSCPQDTGGGVIQIFGSSTQGRILIVNNTITGNQNSSSAGGAISVNFGGGALIQGNTIQNNSTTGNGGGISVSNGSSADIVNNLITGNSAAIGGGVYETVDFFGQSPLFLNNTIADNSSFSPGTAVFIDGNDANMTFSNNLLIDSAGMAAVGCGATSGQIPAFFNNDVMSLAPGVPGFGGICQDSNETGNLNQDPQFVNRANSNYHLQALSPAIDAGIIFAGSIPDQDLDGNGRIGPGNAQTCLGSIDMGAYEFQLASSGSVFLPSTFDLGTAPLSGSNSFFLNLSVSGCVQLSSVKTTGDFTQSNFCGGAVSSSSGCSIQVTFAPTAAGTRTGSLNFDFGTSAPAQTVALTGTGFVAGMNTSPASLNFGSQTVQTSSSGQIVTIFENFFGNSFSSAQVTGIWISGDFAETNGCTPPGTFGITGPQCLFSIVFTPTATGPRTGLLVVSTNQGIATVPLSGTGLAAASATLTPTSLVFPAQLVNTSSVTQFLTLTNTGSTVINPVPTATIGDFVVGTRGCQRPLNPGATCTYPVNFIPTAIGARTGLFTVQSEAGPLSVTLSGTGVAPLPSVSPQSLDFGNQILNTASAAQSVTLANQGNAALAITSISSTGDFAQTNNCTTSLAPNSSCTINVTFTPTALGSRVEALNISTSAGFFSVRLTGTGVNALATTAPAALSFGSELLNTAARAQTITLTAGVNTLQITSIASSGDFAQTNTCSTSLAPGATCAIQVTFTPTVQGPDSGSLVIASNEGSLSVSLSGNGIVRAANTIYVPVDQPTIQAAITNAGLQNVLVLPGTYQENLSFQGKAITVASTDGASLTTLDGGLAGPVVNFSTGETPTSVLSGFTITHGNSSVQGGGVVINSASPTIQNNIITFNQGCGGIGIAVNGGSPVIQNNTISHNIESACSGGDGGGISVLGGAPQILNNVITDNSIPNGGDGGGIGINGASPTIIGNVIQRNSVFNDGGGISLINAADANIVQNLITDNHATGTGGGIYFLVPSGDRGPWVINNTIAANTASSGSAILSDGFASNVQIVNNVLVGTTGVAAMQCNTGFSSTPPILNANDAFSSSGTGYAGSCSTAAGTNGNISVDPQFVDTVGKNYRLLATSPVIDVGNNAAPNLPPVDLDGNARIAFGSASTCSDTVDLGAYEFVLTTVPAATLTPASFDFGIQPVGTTSASQSFTLTATQGCVSPGAIAASGDFSQTNNCSAALATGASCAVQVSFTPSTGGLRNGTLTVNASGAALTSSLTGQGGFAAASLSPASLNFGNQHIQTTSAAQLISLTNTGNLPLQISGISAAGPFTQSNTCPASLAPAAACSINVTFSPVVAGAAIGNLTVTSNSSSSPNAAALSGIGTAPIAVLTPNLTFAGQIVQTTSSQIATLTNSGTAALNISSVATNGDFSAVSSCPPALAPGTSCNIQISFTPSAAGTRTGSLLVTDDDPNGGQQTSALSGTGLDYTISASPASVTVKAGQAALDTTAVSALGGSFSNAVSLACSGLPTGATCSFSPASLTPGSGSASSSLSLTTSSGQHGIRKTPAGTYTVTVTGTSAQLTHSTTLKLIVQ